MKFIAGLLIFVLIILVFRVFEKWMYKRILKRLYIEKMLINPKSAEGKIKLKVINARINRIKKWLPEPKKSKN